MPRHSPSKSDDPMKLDANQVVAYNFRLARERVGWTQDETAARLERYLGQRLKKSSISTIERSVESDRRRVFTVQEVVAFALTFDVSFLWFLIPPPDQGLTLEGLEGPLAQLWRIAVGTDDQAKDIEERLTDLASASPEAAAEMAEAALDLAPGVTLSHFEGRRTDMIIDLIVEERDGLDDFFAGLKQAVERYESLPSIFALAADSPRHAYRNTSEMILGEKVWQLIHEATKEQLPGPALFDLVIHKDVPWESLIDTDRPDVRDAVLQLAEAIEPDIQRYLHDQL